MCDVLDRYGRRNYSGCPAPGGTLVLTRRARRFVYITEQARAACVRTETWRPTDEAVFVSDISIRVIFVCCQNTL